MPKQITQKAAQLAPQTILPNRCSLAESAPYCRRIFRPQEPCQPAYIRKNGFLFTEDCLHWMRTICDASVDLIFADPPYNIKKADWDKFDSQEEYIQWSLGWIAEAARILKPTGSQYANRQKKAALWTPNPLGAKPKDVFEIPTTCNGMGEKTEHPTQKPEELLRKLVLASSRPGDVVVDPFSGSGTTLVVAEQLQRIWVGCEMNETYNTWAIGRIDRVVPRTVEDWIAFDRENAKRRESIR